MIVKNVVSQEQPSLAITILCNGTIKTATVSCLLESFTYLPIRKQIGFIVGGYPAFSRNLAVKRARDLKVTHLMFLDADQTFPGDGIKRLLDQKKDIIGGIYNERRMPLQSTVKLMDANGKMISGKGEDIPRETFKAYAMGCGFLLIKLTVFDKIPEPWFNTQIEPDFKTEDIYFFEKARSFGFDVWADPTINIGHIGDFTY